MTNSLFNLSGKVAAVSGAASGMGRAMLLALAEAGADVVAIDLNQEGARGVAREIKELGQKCHVAKCDVSNPDDIRAMFESIDEAFGCIDFLGNVAGEAVREKPEKIQLKDIESSWRNLVLGRFCCCQEAGRRMLARGKGSIVNIGSLASVTALGRGHIGYSMAMGAEPQRTRKSSSAWPHRRHPAKVMLAPYVTSNGLHQPSHACPSTRERVHRGAVKRYAAYGLPLRAWVESEDDRAAGELAEKARRRALVVILSDCFCDGDALRDELQHLPFQTHDLALFHLLDPLELVLLQGEPRSLELVQLIHHHRHPPNL